MLTFMIEKDMESYHTTPWLSYDSVAVKEKITFNVHTLRMVGYAANAFDLDVIKNGMTAQMDEKESSPPAPLAKHFLIFIFTGWEVKDCPKFLVTAARYATQSRDANFLRDEIIHVMSSLCKFGVIVHMLTPDGASENRSFAKQVCTYSVGDLLIKKINQPCPKLLKIVDLDLKVAVDLPIITKVKVFVSSYPPPPI